MQAGMDLTLKLYSVLRKIYQSEGIRSTGDKFKDVISACFSNSHHTDCVLVRRIEHANVLIPRINSLYLNVHFISTCSKNKL